MNPAKRKKLLRLELAQKNQEVTQPNVEQQKVEVQEDLKQTVEQAASSEASTLEMGLKLTEEKKDKKKKINTETV